MALVSAQAKLKSYPFLITKINIFRPRFATLSGSSSFLGSGVNPHTALAAISVAGSTNASAGALRPRQAQISGSASFISSALGGVFQEAELDNYFAKASLSVSASRATPGAASISAAASISGLLSRFTPAVSPLSATLVMLGSARRQAHAFSLLQGKAATTIIYAGVPRPGAAGLAVSVSVASVAVSHRGGVAFPHIAATASALAAARRRARAALAITSQCASAYNAIQAGYINALKGVGSVVSVAAALRLAMALLPAHKTRLVSRAWKSPSAVLVGSARIAPFWPDKIHAVSSSLSASSATRATPSCAAIMFAVAQSAASARRNRHVVAAVSVAGSLASVGVLREGPKPSLSASSAMSAVAGLGVNVNASLAASAAAPFSASRGIMVAGNFAASGAVITLASRTEGPKPSFAASAVCVVAAHRQANAESRVVAKAIALPTAVATRFRYVNAFRSRAFAIASAGAVKEREANFLMGSNISAGWGKYIDAVTIEIVS